MNSKKTILIAGGSGLIGRPLANALTNDGHEVRILTRNPRRLSPYPIFYWNPAKMQINSEAMDDVDIVVNLAGEPIAGRRWTLSQKQKIADSRVLSTQLLYQTIKKRTDRPVAFVGASGIGYYGQVTREKPFTENEPPGSDYLATTCVRWEDAAKPFESSNIRTVLLRTGVVLSPEGGAFTKMTMTKKFGFLNALGSGRQYFPWIHIDDIVGIYQFAITHPLSGIFNAVAPAMNTQSEFIDAVVEASNRVIRLPNIPCFLIKLLMGEMSVIVLKGSPVSCEKIQQAGYSFKYLTLEKALIHQITGL